MIKVDFYQKQGHCPQCLNMDRAIRSWVADTTEWCQVSHYFIEDHPEIVQKAHASSAPVVRIVRDDKEQFVSGNNPDILIDMLNGQDTLWDFDM